MRCPKFLLVSALSALAVSTAALSASALEYLAAESLVGTKVRIDGMLAEWPGGFVKLTVKASGTGKPVEALVAYDEQKLYLAAKVKDAAIVRTPGAGKGDDRLTLDLFVPSESGRGGETHTISVYPGHPGKLPGLVHVDGRSVAAGKAVEAPTEDGFVLEAELPWSAIRGTEKVRVGLRGKLSYHDASAGGRVQSIVSSSKGSGASMPPLTLEAETGLYEALLEPRGLSPVPAREAYGDLTGKGGRERVALYGHFLSIVGPRYKGGKQFYFSELDVPSADRVRRLEVRDLTGDGKGEIVIEKRIGAEDAYRQVIEVLSLGKDGAPQSVFIHEVSLVTAEGHVDNEVEISGSGASSRITISQGKAEGFEPGTFQEPTIGAGIPSALLPWESTFARVYGWKGTAFVELETKTWQPKVKKSGPRSVAAAPAKAPPPPRPPTADELQDRVYALYKKDRGVGARPPRFDFVTDVVDDEQMERVVVHGQDLVVFGKGFKKGLSYTFLTMGVKDEKDVLSVTTRDLVGDGKAEILVHAIVRTQASKELGGEVVLRQALFVYKVLGENLVRIFAAETGRALGDARVLGAVAFSPSGRGTDITLKPLTAIGWTERSYPFPEDHHPAGGLEPLLLPWTTATPRRYVFDGKSYALR